MSEIWGACRSSLRVSPLQKLLRKQVWRQNGVFQYISSLIKSFLRKIVFLLPVLSSSGCCLSFPLSHYFSSLSSASSPGLLFYFPPCSQRSGSPHPLITTHFWHVFWHLANQDAASESWGFRLPWGIFQRGPRYTQDISWIFFNPFKVTLTSSGLKFWATGGFYSPQRETFPMASLDQTGRVGCTWFFLFCAPRGSRMKLLEPDLDNLCSWRILLHQILGECRENTANISKL